MAILPDLTQASRDDLLAMIEALKKQSATKLTLKVTEKGGLSVYGMGRFPVTLYASQWERLLDSADTIRAFIASHSASLARKAD